MVARRRTPTPHSKRPRVLTTYMVKQLELAVRQEIDRVVRPFGLTAPQYTALSVLARHPGLSSAEMARHAFVSPQAANQMVAALERKGVVTRTAHVAHQRALGMELTATGHSSLADCNKAVVRIENRMLADLDRDERATLRDLLSRCLGSVHEDRPAFS